MGQRATDGLQRTGPKCWYCKVRTCPLHAGMCLLQPQELATHRHHLLSMPTRSKEHLAGIGPAGKHLLAGPYIWGDIAAQWPTFAPWNPCCETGMKSFSVATKSSLNSSHQRKLWNFWKERTDPSFNQGWAACMCLSLEIQEEAWDRLMIAPNNDMALLFHPSTSATRKVSSPPFSAWENWGSEVPWCPKEGNRIWTVLPYNPHQNLQQCYPERSGDPWGTMRWWQWLGRKGGNGWWSHKSSNRTLLPTPSPLQFHGFRLTQQAHL